MKINLLVDTQYKIACSLKSFPMETFTIDNYILKTTISSRMLVNLEAVTPQRSNRFGCRPSSANKCHTELKMRF